MAYSYKGSISFGLVYIPVTLHSTIKENDIGFNMIDKKTMSRVKYKKTCADCEGREVKQEDIVKGFEYEDGKYVIFEDKDFEKIKSKKDKNITIEKFVNLSEVDTHSFSVARGRKTATTTCVQWSSVSVKINPTTGIGNIPPLCREDRNGILIRKS